MLLKGKVGEFDSRGLCQIRADINSRVQGSLRKDLFAVGDPDVFDLGGVVEEEAVGRGGGIEPVEGAAFVGENLFEVADGEGLGGGAGGFVGETPDSVNVVVFGESFEELGGTASDNVDRACGKIGGFEKRIEIAGDERIDFAGNGYNGVAQGERGHNRGEEAEERRFAGATDTDDADRFMHRECDVAEGRIVDGAIEFIGPGGEGKNAFDAKPDFGVRLIFTDNF